MYLLVAYDVETTTPEGRRRLRRVARVCQDYGQRVQYSVFEVSVGETDLVRFRGRLLGEIDPEKDSLRLYVLGGRFAEVVEAHGRNRSIDFEGPLVV
jgi:CRISPR-associated protein Cas2